MKTSERIHQLIAESSDSVVVNSEFSNIASASQVSRALSQLVQAGVLVRVSKGAYAKARRNRFTGQPSPVGTLESIAAELLQKLHIPIQPSQYVQAYNTGKTTQIPMGATVNTGRRRITRKITVGQRTLAYEARNYPQ